MFLASTTNRLTHRDVERAMLVLLVDSWRPNYGTLLRIELGPPPTLSSHKNKLAP